jgi:hypothetical protein
MTWTCETCNLQVPVPGEDAIPARGHWWHKPCALKWFQDTIDFPSNGKLIPETIITKCS